MIDKRQQAIGVLCLDPQSSHFYVHNFSTHSIWLPDYVPSDFKQRAKVEIQALRNLLNLKEFNWNQNKNIESYRRRSIPEHLLKRPKYVIPCYVSQSRLPRAINETQKIQLIINFKDYRELNYYYVQQVLQVYILSAVAQVLKSLFRQVYQKDVKKFLQLKSIENQFCLKHKGHIQFLFGRHPIINFQCVRKALQQHRPLNLQLSEIQKQTISRTKFPPLFRITSENPRQVPWRLLRQSQILMYYPPFPFSNQNLLKAKQIQSLKFDETVDQSVKQQFSGRHKNNLELIKTMKQFELNDIKRQFSSRPRTKQQALKTLTKRTRDIQDKIIYTGKNLIYSGQCQYDFQFSLIGIDNFYSLFQAGQDVQGKDKSYLSTFNGQFQPTYLSKPKAEKRDLPIKLYKKDTGTQVNRNFATYGPFGYRSQRSSTDIDPYTVIIKVCLYHGVKKLCQWQSKAKIVSNQLRFNDTFRYPKLSRIALQGRFTFQVITITSLGQSTIVGSGIKKIFDCYSSLNNGIQQIILWPFYSIDPRISCGMSNYAGKNKQPYAKLFIKFPIFTTAVNWSLRSQSNIIKLKWSDKPLIKEDYKKTSESISQLQKLIKIDPLNSKKLTQIQKKLLTQFRYDYRGLSHKFSTFLDSISWDNPNQVFYALQAKSYWTKLTPLDALNLVDAYYADQAIRVFACQCMNSFCDDQLKFCMPQLIQALTFQSHHFSILGQFLLDRSLQNPYVVGFALYCQIKSQLRLRMTFERLALILQQFIMLCGNFRKILIKTYQSTLLLQQLSTSHKYTTLQKAIDQFNKKIQKPFTLSIQPRQCFIELVKQLCQIRDSKKKPIGAVFKNNDQQLVKYFLKYGDDLRQDSFAIQIMKFMNRIWLDAGITTQLCFYNVQALRDDFGIIQAIQAETLHTIQTKDGKFNTFKDSVIYDYLKKLCPQQKQLRVTQKTFMHSLAGSVVATFILGVADRHPSNVMLTKKGQFFHIDYGNIVGNFKEKLSVKRQISPFLFTQDIAYVLGGRKGQLYQKFSQLCGRLYILIRRKADQIINLMMMMLSAGLPQLNKQKDIEYCVNMLRLQLSQTEAKLRIKDLLLQSLNNETRRRVDNFAHNLRRD